MHLSLDRDGAQLFPNLVGGDSLRQLDAILSVRPRGAGVRISADPKLQEWISHDSPVRQLARSFLGAATQPVRAILFDKNDAANWVLGWHQDRTIAVRKRVDVEGFANWTLKAGIPHVEPPFGVLERMVTARIHLDRVSGDNGPLLIIPGSHRLGRLTEDEIGGVVTAGGQYTCLASGGDMWLYATPIVHASEASRHPTGRRVLQLDFSADKLPGALEWAGVGGD